MRLRKLPGLQQANITRYTYDAWKKCFPKASYNEWYEQTYPDNILDFLEAASDTISKRYSSIEKTKFMVVTINKEYFKWINENKLEDSIKTRTAYADQMTAETAKRLIKDEHMNQNYQMMFLYGVARLKEDKNTNFVLPVSVIEKINKYLNIIFKSQETFIPGYVLKMETAIMHSDKLLNLAKAYFEDHQSARLGMMETQEYVKGTNVALYFIPIIFKKEFDEAIFEYNDIYGRKDALYERYPELITFDKDGFSEYGIDRIGFEETGISQEINKIFYPNKFDMVPNLARLSEIMDIEEEFVKELKKNGAKILVS